MIENKKELWRLSIISRLLFNSPEESEPILRRKASEISKIEDEIEIADIFDRMNNECIRQTQYGLKYIVNAYKDASEAYADNNLWNNRRTLAKKNLCLKLFIKKYAPDTPVIRDVLRSIKGNDSDDDLLELLTDINSDGTEKKDVCFLLLLAWGIINPFRLRTKKRKDSKESIKLMLNLLRELDKCLKGKIGILLETPIVNSIHSDLENCFQSHHNVTTAQLWSYLDLIGDTLRSFEIENLGALADETDICHLPGIWIDDADQGASRFWIFPVNLKMAFLYKYSNSIWRLLPFEFILYKPDINDSDTWYTGMITAKANELLILGDQVPTEEVVTCDYIAEYDESGVIDKISFTPHLEPVPEWHDWHSFIRLSESDSRFVKYNNVLTSFYPKNQMFAEELRCGYRWMIDIQWALVAIDADYLYVVDFKALPYYRLIKAKDDKSGGVESFNENDYVYNPSASCKPMNLYDIQINDAQPLYRIPRDAKSAFRYFDPKEKEEYEMFRYIVKNINYGDQVTIYRVSRKNKVRRAICFNKYSRIYELDKIVAEYGVRKFTSKKDLFGL